MMRTFIELLKVRRQEMPIINNVEYLHIYLCYLHTEILPSKDKSRATIQLEIQRKEKAVEKIVRSYSNSRLTSEIIRQVSI